MSDFNVLYIINVINSILTIVLLFFVYTYLTNLEAKGCECSSSPNANFIKSFTLFAIFYLVITKFIPDSMIKDNFGGTFLIFKGFIDLIFFVVFIFGFSLLPLFFILFLVLSQISGANRMARRRPL